MREEHSITMRNNSLYAPWNRWVPFCFAIVLTAASVYASTRLASGDSHDPEFVDPTPTCGSTIQAVFGTRMSFTVQASDVDSIGVSGDVVTLDVIGLPASATMTPSLPTSGNPVSSLFDWTPDVAGQTVVTFTATDLAGHQVSCDLTIDVGVPHDPEFVDPTPTCGSTIQAVFGTPMNFTVKASDVDSSDLGSGEVVTLDVIGLPSTATMTPSLPTSGNPVSSVFDWTPDVAGQTVVTFTATDAAGHQVSCDLTIDVGIPPPEPFCFGNGGGDIGFVGCPCANNGSPGNGCANSDHPGGANLAASGNASLSSDTLVLIATDIHPASLQLFIQGDAEIPPTQFGDGLRCISGELKRLFRVKGAQSESVQAPSDDSLPPSPATISGQSAARGDVLSVGNVRGYQVYYRDPVLLFCPSPLGDTFNVTNGVRVTWGP